MNVYYCPSMQGVLLDEASGVKKNEQPVLPAVVQQGTAEVASWNKKKVSSEGVVGEVEGMKGRVRDELHVHFDLYPRMLCVSQLAASSSFMPRTSRDLS